MVDFRNDPRKHLDETPRLVNEVMTDPYRGINPRARHQEAMRLVRERQSAHNELTAQAKQAYEAEVERLERQANPAPQRGRRSTAEMMERRELLDMNLPRWERSQGLSVLDEYRKALSQGDQMMVELIEDFAGQYIKDPARSAEFGDLLFENKRARLPASAQTALTQLEELVAEESNIMGGLELQKSTMAGLVDNVRRGQPTAMREQSAGFAEHERELATVGGGEAA